MNKARYEQVYDVIIAGGGVSGVAAAVSALKEGASVLLIEQNGYLGGTLTSCGVGPMMTFHAGEQQVIKGFMEEVVQEMVRRGYSSGHVHDTTRYISYLTPFEAEGLKLVLDDFVMNAGGNILFHTFIGDVIVASDRIQQIQVVNKDGLNKIGGKIFIDATGDGDIAYFAGVPMNKGRVEDGLSQPMTMKMKYCNVDTAQIKRHVLSHLEDFPRLKDNVDLLEENTSLALAGFATEFNIAKEAGEISIPREDILFFETNRPGEYIINTTRIINHDSTDAFSLSDAELIGRKQCEELDRFLKKYIPGFQNALLEYTGPSIGVRGSRQLIGQYTLTAKDILDRKAFDSVIAHSAYPIDIHNPKGEGTESRFMSELGTYYSIPYEIMYSDVIKNLLVTGRCVSASFEAQAAIRTTPTVGALGQASGIAAVLAAETGDVTSIDIKELQKKLVHQDAFLDI